MATIKACFKYTFLLFSLLVALSLPIFATTKQMKEKEKVTSPIIFEAIVEDANVIL